MIRRLTFLLLWLPASPALAEGATEFCLEGERDLGVRFQGIRPEPGELYPTRWCVVTEDDAHRALFSAAGKANPDMDDDFTVAYLPPDTVRIVNREAPPDIEFQGTDNLDEALRTRRMDPRRLVEEYRSNSQAFEGVTVEITEGRLATIRNTADLPLRGRVAVEWRWDWTDPSRPKATLTLDGEVLLRATGRWRELSKEEAEPLWKATPGADPIEVPGDRWPSRVAMQLINLTDGVYLVRGVRTGFQHLVVETDEGLVVGDAPAGWVEFHRVPASDMVPGLGISGLSEGFVDFLAEEFPGRKIRAVALTHFHDDHAGGARAFAATGAAVYAPAPSGDFLSAALNDPALPEDRLAHASGRVKVRPVATPVILGDAPNRVKLLPLGSSPHVEAMLGIWALDREYFFVSDVHVPRSESSAPPADRAATECWFASWAVENLPSEVRVVNSHSPVVSPVSRLAQYLESDVCRALADRQPAG